MRTVETSVYKFEELSDAAKSEAIENYRTTNEDLGRHWQDENFESIKAVLDFFDVEITNYSIDYSSAAGSYVSWSLNLDYDEEIKNLSGARLFKYIQNNYIGRVPGAYGHIFDGKPDEGRCIFTGYCADHSVIEPVINFLERPTKNISFEDLIDDIIYAGLKYMEQDYEAQMSD